MVALMAGANHIKPDHAPTHVAKPSKHASGKKEETRQDLAAANNNETPQVTLGRGAGGGGIGRLLTSVSLNMDSSGFFTLSARASSSISGAPEPC